MDLIINSAIAFVSILIPTLIIFTLLLGISKLTNVDSNKPISKKVLFAVSLVFYLLIGIVLFYISYLDNTSRADSSLLNYFIDNPIRVIWPISFMIGM